MVGNQWLYLTCVSGEDKQMESEASFQLGVTYQKTGDHNTAKQVLQTVPLYTLLSLDLMKRSKTTCC